MRIKNLEGMQLNYIHLIAKDEEGRDHVFGYNILARNSYMAEKITKAIAESDSYKDIKTKDITFVTKSIWTDPRYLTTVLRR